MAEATHEIGSAAQLAAALQSGESDVRIQVYRALDGMLTRAETEGRTVNPELAEVLHARYRGLARDPERDMVAALLLRVPGDVSLEVARHEFFTTGSETLLVLAAQRLSRLPAAERATLLGPCVMDDSNALRCRAAANLLDDCLSALPAAQALRVALVSDHALHVPAVNTSTLEAWLAELAGPYSRSARAAVLALCNEALITLLDAWDRLSPELRTWVLPVCVAAERNDRCKDHAAQRVCKILRGAVAAPDSVTIAELLLAIDSVRQLAAVSKSLDEALLLPCYRHPDPRVRTAAVAAGSEALDWSEMLANERDAKIRAALAERMGRCGGAGVANRLGVLLKDGGWRVRARAAAALAGMGPDGFDVLQRAMVDEDEGARVAAAHGLMQMGSIGTMEGIASR